MKKCFAKWRKNGHLAGITAARCLCFHTFRVKYEKIPRGKCNEEAERLEAERKAEAERLERERKEEEHRIAVEKAKKKAKKVFIAIASVACVCAVFLILLKTVIIPQYKLNKATQLIDSGNYKAAYMLLDGLSYRDSAEKLKSAKQAQIKNAKVGDIVYFGAYEQDNNTSNGKELIEWLALAKENNRVLVISDKALDCRAFDTSGKYVTWEKCSLRKWLNNDFFNTAFSDDEKAAIPTVTVLADKNSTYNTDPGNATQDQVFLLSIVEAKKYFSSDSARQCSPTDYAVANGAYKSNDNVCWWWLRSPGDIQSTVAFINYDGSVYKFGNSAYRDYDDAVRPAMWITIDG